MPSSSSQTSTRRSGSGPERRAEALTSPPESRSPRQHGRGVLRLLLLATGRASLSRERSPSSARRGGGSASPAGSRAGDERKLGDEEVARVACPGDLLHRDRDPQLK